MQKEKLIKILNDFRDKKISQEKALDELKFLPFEDMGFAKIDHHRNLRNGFPEVVFCQGKTKDQIKKIFFSLKKHNDKILLTRADEKIFRQLKKYDKRLKYSKNAKAIYIESTKSRGKGNILVICAGTADIPVAEEAAITAEVIGNNVERVYDVGVAGIHRLLSYKKSIFNAKCI